MASSPARWESSSFVPWELRPSLGARLGVRHWHCGTCPRLSVTHSHPHTHPPLLSSPEKQGVCIAAVTGALPLLEAVRVLSLGKHFSSPRLWHGWSQHSPPGFPVMRDSPAAVQKNSPFQICDGDLKFCLQGPEGVEPGESYGVLRRGQPLRARRGSGVGFPGS